MKNAPQVTANDRAGTEKADTKNLHSQNVPSLNPGDKITYDHENRSMVTARILGTS